MNATVITDSVLYKYYVVKKSEANFSNPAVLLIPDCNTCTFMSAHVSSFLPGHFYLLTYAEVLQVKSAYEPSGP